LILGEVSGHGGTLKIIKILDKKKEVVDLDTATSFLVQLNNITSNPNSNSNSNYNLNLNLNLNQRHDYDHFISLKRRYET
jgi:hypothetical protein